MNKQYRQYLQSDVWKAKRLQLYKLRGYKCERCDSIQQIDVHHKTYDNIFHEPMTDLELLCRVCHAKHHGIGIKVKKQQQIKKYKSLAHKVVMLKKNKKGRKKARMIKKYGSKWQNFT